MLIIHRAEVVVGRFMAVGSGGKTKFIDRARIGWCCLGRKPLGREKLRCEAVLACRERLWRKVGEVRAAYRWNSACLVEDDDGCWPHGVGFQPVVLLSTGRKEGRKGGRKQGELW